MPKKDRAKEEGFTAMLDRDVVVDIARHDFDSISFSESLLLSFPGWDEFRLVSVHIILEGISHNGSKSTRGKTISRMCTDPLKKRLPEYLKLSKPKLLALPEKPLRLKGR